MSRPRHLTIIMWFAVVQGLVAVLVALFWFGVAHIFSPDSGVTSPLIVMLAETKGGILIVLALTYFVFAWGAWRIRGWAWWVGLLASTLNVLYMARVLLGGGSVVAVLIVSIIPVVVIWYLFSPTGRRVLGR